MRESRREDAPPVLQDVGLVDLRVREEVSGSNMVDEAGLDAMALDDAEELSGLSQGAVFCRRRVPGLMWDPDEAA